MPVRDIHSEQELLFIGNLKLRKVEKLSVSVLERCSVCLWCVNSFTVHQPSSHGFVGICRVPNNPEGKGQQVAERGGKKWCLARREHWFYNVQWENLLTRRLWPRRSLVSSSLLPKQLLWNQLHLYVTEEKGFSQVSHKPRQEEAEPLLLMKFWRLFYDFPKEQTDWICRRAAVCPGPALQLSKNPGTECKNSGRVTLSGTREYLGVTD